MSKQQTAVEWLVQQYIEGNYGIEVYEQAKAMEKGQIEAAYNAGREYGCKHDDPETGEQYYKESFKTESE